MQESLEDTQKEPSPERETTMSSDAKLLARVRQDLIGHQHIETVDEFVKVCDTLAKTLNKYIHHKHGDDVVKYKKFYHKVRSYILAWTREFTCEHCGEVNDFRAYHFHHEDPKTRLVNVGSTGVGFGTRLRESLKCVYLCETCHYSEHDRLGELDGYFNTINRRGHNIIQSVLGLSD